MPEPDYRQSDVTGQKWRRSCHGEFDNEHGKVPWIRFDWEDRISLADGTTLGTPVGSTLRHFSDPAATLTLCNPETGAPTGQTVTHGEVVRHPLVARDGVGSAAGRSRSRSPRSFWRLTPWC